MNIHINFDCDPFSKIIFSNGAKQTEKVFKKPYMYLVKRGNIRKNLDFELKNQAVLCGVDIHFESTIPQNMADIIAIGPFLENVPGIAKGIIFKTKLKDTIITLFNDKAAFKGYSYLLVTKGYGCMCAVVLNEIHRVNECFEETKKIFFEMIDFDIQNPKQVGGVGAFSLKSNFKKDNSLLVGEAAGLQDMLWGFGTRYAFVSGFLAAQSIIEGFDYNKKAQAQFSNKLKSSMVNRFLWENISFGKYEFLIDRFKNHNNLLNSLFSFYNFNLFQKLIYPLALFYANKKYPNLKL